MGMKNPRQLLEQLCAERGENFSSLSRLIGRNDAYIQQFVRRGTPRKLRDRERRILARHFQIPEFMLEGKSAESADSHGSLVSVMRLPVRSAVTSGAPAIEESGEPCLAFDPQWLSKQTTARASDLSIIRVEGDSMAPTLGEGDDVLVDRTDGAGRFRDGIYVLRVEGALLARRLAIHPVGGKATVQSDNPSYTDMPGCSLDEIDCFGRVIWAGRKIA